MVAKVLNIEICDNTIKVCRIARKGKGVRILDSFMFPTPDDCVSDGSILNPQLLSHELKKQLSAHGLQNIKNVIFALSSSKVAAREVKLPQMKKKLISAAIKTNVEDYFPIDLKSYHIAYCILENATSAEPSNRILVMAAPVSMLEGYFQLAEKSGLNIKAIDTCSNSQYQALKRINLAGVTVYVDVSGSSSIVSFIRDNKLLLQRSFAFGADELISNYMDVSGKSKEQYFEVLHETDITHPDFTADKLLSLSDVQRDLDHLVGSIVRSIDYFNSSPWEATATRVVLIGTNRHIVGIRELLSEATGLETLYLDDIPDFATITNGAVEAPTYISCIGSSIAPLDLIPQQYLSSRRKVVDDKDSSIVSSVIVSSVIIVASILVSLSAWLNYHYSVVDLKSMQEEITKLQYAKETYDYYISYQKSDEAVKAITEAENTPNSKLVSFFKELETKMPSSILILSADCSNDGVSMNITVGSYTDAASVISSLRSFDNLSNVSVSDLSEEQNEAGISRVLFTVTCTYGTNPYQNNVNPYSELISPPAVASDATSGTTTGTASPSPAQ